MKSIRIYSKELAAWTVNSFFYLKKRTNVPVYLCGDYDET